jgi:tape measure domain-containing protein
LADANVRVVISAEDRASRTLQGFSGKAVAVGAAFGTFVGNVATDAVSRLAGQLGEATKRVDTLANASRTFENMGFKAADVTSTMEKLNKSILGLPTPLNEAVQGVEMLAAANNDIAGAQGIYTALNDGILGFGGTTADVSNAVLQFSQDLAGGRIQAQTWNSLLQSGLGPTLAAMARQMGLTTKGLKDGLSDGSISVKKFTDELIAMDQNGGGGLKSLHQIAMDSTNGIQTSFENAKTAIVRSLAGIIDAIGQQNIAAAITTIGTSIAGLITLIRTTTQSVDWGVIFGAIKLALDALRPAFEQLWVALATQLGPALERLWVALQPLLPFIGIVLVAAIYALITALTIVVDIFARVVGAIAAFVDWITRAAGVTNASAGQMTGAISGVNEAFRVMENVAHIVTSSIGNSIIGMLGPIGQVISAVNNAKEGIRQLDNLISNISAGNVKGTLHALHVPGFATGVENFGGGLAVVGERGPELVNLPRGSNVIPNNQISGGTTVNVNFSGVFTSNEADMRRLADKVFKSAADVASGKSMTLSEMYG